MKGKSRFDNIIESGHHRYIIFTAFGTFSAALEILMGYFLLDEQLDLETRSGNILENGSDDGG